MSSGTNNILNEYMRDIRTLLPLKGEEEKRFLTDIKVSAEAYMEDHPGCSALDLQEEMGTPAEIVSTYFESIDTDKLLKRVRISKHIRWGIIIIIAIAVAIGAATCAVYYKNYKDGQNSYVDREVTEIVED